MMPTTMLIIAGVLALVATVLAFIYVVPEKRRLILFRAYPSWKTTAASQGSV